jgi:hypothetical protein
LRCIASNLSIQLLVEGQDSEDSDFIPLKDLLQRKGTAKAKDENHIRIDGLVTSILYPNYNNNGTHRSFLF